MNGMNESQEVGVIDLDEFSTRVKQQLREFSDLHRTLKSTGIIPKELTSMMRRSIVDLRVIGDEIEQLSIAAARKRV